MRLHTVVALANRKICEFFRFVTLPSLLRTLENYLDQGLSIELHFSTNSRDKLMIEYSSAFETLSTAMKCHLTLNAKQPQEDGEISINTVDEIERKQLGAANKVGAFLVQN